jgi:hypothetical protein
MAKGDQRNEKMVKKPKKSVASTSQRPSPGLSDRPTAPVTLVMPKGAEKKK